MKKRIIKSLIALIAVVIIMAAVLFASSQIKKKKVNDIWDELGIEPYMEGIRVIYEDRYFTMSDNGSVKFETDKEPDEPYCLIIPEEIGGQKVTGVDLIEDSQNIRDVILLSSGAFFGFMNCPNVGRVVCGENIGQEEFDFSDIDEAISPEYDSIIESVWNYFRVSTINLNSEGSMYNAIFQETENYMIIYHAGNNDKSDNMKFPKHTLGMEDCFYSTMVEAFECPESLYYMSGCFGNCDYLTYVKCNEGLKVIDGSFTFLGSEKKCYIAVPASVEYIEDSFEYCGDITLVVEKDSYAEEYALDNNIDYMYYEDFDFDAHQLEYEQ